ncbi:MAG: ThuA domain-containing protein, partial [Verrucomicrobiota bacterium]
MKNLILLLGLVLSGSLAPLTAAEKAKVVFVSGKPSHGPMAHEHRAGNILLAKRLNEADLGVEAIVLPEDGFPKDASVLEDAATIVVFCTGHQKHLLNPHLREFDALMKNGTGVVMIHWATEAELGMPAKKFLEWMGGFCDLNWSVNPHWKPDFTTFPDHPVANGVKPFSVHDEWYYHMRFVGDLEGVTPILSDLPPPETLTRPDGARSGNPDVRRAVANGESQHVAWAYERPDGSGRGFGFTGAHNHVSWKNDMFRKVVLNAILWTAQVEVPEEGVVSLTPSDDEMKENLDDKPVRKPKPKAKPKPQAKAKPSAAPNQKHPNYPAFDARLVDRAASALFFQEQRARQVVKLDSALTMNLIVSSLRNTSDPDIQKGLLRGLVRGLEGRRSVAAPKEWSALSEQLSEVSGGEIRSMVQQLDQVFGDEAAAARALAQLKDTTLSPEERKTILSALVTQQNTRLKEVLPSLLDEADLRVPAIRAYGGIDDPEAPSLIFARYSNWDDETRRAAIETLAMRKNYAEALLVALRTNQVPKEDIPAHVARPLASLLGDPFTEVFGDLDELSKDKAELMERYTTLLTDKNLQKADASKGRLVFAAACAACHQLYGEGGALGPDLTGSNRADLSYILLNMIEP